MAFFAPDQPTPHQLKTAWMKGDVFCLHCGPSDERLFFGEVLIVSPSGRISSDTKAVGVITDGEARFAKELADYYCRLNARKLGHVLSRTKPLK